MLDWDLSEREKTHHSGLFRCTSVDRSAEPVEGSVVKIVLRYDNDSKIDCAFTGNFYTGR